MADISNTYFIHLFALNSTYPPTADILLIFILNIYLRHLRITLYKGLT